MGLQPEAVWGLTLKQLGVLRERYMGQVRAEDRRAGEIVAMIYNVNRDQKKDPKGATWEDIFPERADAEQQTDEQMYAAMMLWAQVSTKRHA